MLPFKQKYFAGQLWSLRTDDSESGEKLLVLKYEVLDDKSIVHVSVIGDNNAGYPDHMPFEEEAINSSVTNLCQEDFPLDDFEEGYNYWRTLFNRGEAGI